MSRKYWVKVEGLDSAKELEFYKETQSILNYLGSLNVMKYITFLISLSQLICNY